MNKESFFLVSGCNKACNNSDYPMAVYIGNHFIAGAERNHGNSIHRGIRVSFID